MSWCWVTWVIRVKVVGPKCVEKSDCCLLFLVKNDYNTSHLCHNSFWTVFVHYIAEHFIWLLEPGVRGSLMIR